MVISLRPTKQITRLRLHLSIKMRDYRWLKMCTKWSGVIFSGLCNIVTSAMEGQLETCRAWRARAADPVTEPAVGLPSLQPMFILCVTRGDAPIAIW